MNQAVQEQKPLTQIAEYNATAAALADLSARYKDVVFDVAVKECMAAAIKGRAEIRRYRIDLEKMRKDLKAPALERSRLIDTEAKRISEELSALEDPIDNLIKLEETRKERDRAEREAAEVARVQHIMACIAEIVAMPAAMVGKNSIQIGVKLADARAMNVTTWAQEFESQAEAARNNAVLALDQLRAGAEAQEKAAADEAERVLQERAELARLRAEQEERDRTERARIAQETRERAEAEAAARAKIEAEQRASREKIEAEERAARLAREEEDRVARAERAAAAAKAKAEQDAKDEQDRVERAARKAEEDRVAKEQAERDRALRAESDRLEAEKREVARQQAELEDGTTILRKFVERFGRRREFAAVVKAIKLHLESK